MDDLGELDPPYSPLSPRIVIFDALLADLETTASHISKHPVLPSDPLLLGPQASPPDSDPVLTPHSNGTPQDLAEMRPPPPAYTPQQTVSSAMKSGTQSRTGDPERLYSTVCKPKSPKSKDPPPFTSASVLGGGLTELDHLLQELNATQFNITDEILAQFPSSKTDEGEKLKEFQAAAGGPNKHREEPGRDKTAPPTANSSSTQMVKPTATSATLELDKLMASLSDFKVQSNPSVSLPLPSVPLSPSPSTSIPIPGSISPFSPLRPSLSLSLSEAGGGGVVVWGGPVCRPAAIRPSQSPDTDPGRPLLFTMGQCSPAEGFGAFRKVNRQKVGLGYVEVRREETRLSASTTQASRGEGERAVHRGAVGELLSVLGASLCDPGLLPPRQESRVVWDPLEQQTRAPQNLTPTLTHSPSPSPSLSPSPSPSHYPSLSPTRLGLSFPSHKTPPTNYKPHPQTTTAPPTFTQALPSSGQAPPMSFQPNPACTEPVHTLTPPTHTEVPPSPLRQAPPPALSFSDVGCQVDLCDAPWDWQCKPTPPAAQPVVTSSRPSAPTPQTSGSLDIMLGLLQSDLSRQGIATTAKGTCAACQKPIVSQVVTALGQTWHTEHFVCSHCQKEIGGSNFFEKDGAPYCESDYFSLFSPRCKMVTALDRNWHPEHFCCVKCGRPFGEEGFHERDGRQYCQQDFFSMFASRCHGCSKPIQENYISALNMLWHPECFVCRECYTPFVNGSFFEHEGQPLCETHYHRCRGSLCSSCERPITGRCITAMGTKFHPEHFVCAFCLKQLNKGTFKEQGDKPYCHSCFIKLFG
ncbi:LOW QUALITY PROTEIN: transforming growth factor beta-1-induced transcript 1 protein-like [Polyodon spathula]|uniref:LOW QUALITY PROTEIN: transforming growth factor beta-1-induced transcript 1 protein-like n=1 Tax=Polyodon spathula TaxID=7913 RepID=UPI001B7DBFC3|nr:LOW QUALITY PROTEIN: transforming growth factor beta-1-induced transcript 1 protein-like [Polyodon spathula]